MRKAFLTVLFGVALALALAPSAQAADPGKYLGAADFNFRGQYWMWGTYQDNVADLDSDVHDTRRHIYQRFRWYFDTSYEGKYGGTIGFEWNWRWGTDSPGATAIGGGPRGDDLTNNTRIKHAYVWFMLPWTPVNMVKVTAGLGVQPGIDPQNIMFASNDWFGVRLDVPIVRGVVNLTAAWLQDSLGSDPGLTINRQAGTGLSGPDSWSNDGDFYVVHLTANLAKWLNLGAYTVWGHAMENGRIDAQPWGANFAWAGPFSAGYNFTAGGMLGGRTNITLSDGDVLWHGLYFHLRPDPFFINGHVNVMYGNSGVGGETVGFGGGDYALGPAFAYFLQAGVQTGPFKVSARGWWFDADEDGPVGDKFDRWFGPDSFFASTELVYSGYTSWGTGITGYETQPGGTAFAGLEAQWQVTKKLTLDFLVGHLWFTNDSDKPGDTLGYFVGGPAVGALPPNKDKDFGWEINLAGTYKLYDNLAFTLGFNYLFAGSGLDHWKYTYNKWGGGVANFLNYAYTDADDAYEVFWRLLYTF